MILRSSEPIARVFHQFISLLHSYLTPMQIENEDDGMKFCQRHTCPHLSQKKYSIIVVADHNMFVGSVSRPSSRNPPLIWKHLNADKHAASKAKLCLSCTAQTSKKLRHGTYALRFGAMCWIPVNPPGYEAPRPDRHAE